MCIGVCELQGSARGTLAFPCEDVCYSVWYLEFVQLLFPIKLRAFEHDKVEPCYQCQSRN